MFVVQRLGKDAAWHNLPDEYYTLAGVARHRAYELSFEDRTRAFRAKDTVTGEVLITFGPDGEQLRGGV